MHLLLLCCLTPISTNEGWPEYRGPNGDGIANAKNLPTTWSETSNVRWKTAIHDKGWSSPVVNDTQVWVTTADEAGHSYYAVGLDRKTGKIIHDIKLFSEKNPPDIRQFNSYSSPTPALSEGKLYAHFGSHGTACIDTATGKVLWRREDFECDHYRGPASSAVVYQNWLFLQFDGFDKQFLVCLNKESGETIWRQDRDLPYPESGDYKKAFATPAVFEIDGKPQVVSPAATGTMAYDAATGKELWRVITGGMNQACRPILAHGMIYFTTGHTAGLVAVKAGMTGDLTNNLALEIRKTAPTRPSPLIVGDLLFMVNDRGIAYCYDAKTGKNYWSERLGGKFSSSPICAEKMIYAADEEGTTYVFPASKEFVQPIENRLDAGCRASPAAAGEALFLRTETHVYYLGK